MDGSGDGEAPPDQTEISSSSVLTLELSLCISGVLKGRLEYAPVSSGIELVSQVRHFVQFSQVEDIKQSCSDVFVF